MVDLIPLDSELLKKDHDLEAGYQVVSALYEGLNSDKIISHGESFLMCLSHYSFSKARVSCKSNTGRTRVASHICDGLTAEFWTTKNMREFSQADYGEIFCIYSSKNPGRPLDSASPLDADIARLLGLSANFDGTVFEFNPGVRFLRPGAYKGPLYYSVSLDSHLGGPGPQVTLSDIELRESEIRRKRDRFMAEENGLLRNLERKVKRREGPVPPLPHSPNANGSLSNSDHISQIMKRLARRNQIL
jgi:hypothetical protein